MLTSLLFWKTRTRQAGASAVMTRRRQARLELETLEDRRTPTVVFNPHFGPETVQGTNDGMQNPPVHLIFSGAYWTTPQGQQDETSLVNSTKHILGSPYLSGLKQYGASGTAAFADNWNDAGVVPSLPSTAALQNFLQNSINHHNQSAPGFLDWQHAPIYVVISDPASSNQYGGGWNSTGHYLQVLGDIPVNVPIHMIWIGTSTTNNMVNRDSYTLTLSHEMAETISDPDANGITITPPANLPANIKGDSQIGDNEGNGYLTAYRLGGDLVQGYWSRNDQAFIVPDGNKQKFFMDQIWNGNTPTFTYNLSVQGDQLGANYADSIRIDNVANTSAKATMNNESVLFDKGVIHNINIDTGGGSNYVDVAGVPAGVTLNVNSSGKSNDLVFVGSDNQSLAGIQGTVNVSNASGHTTLDIDAFNDGPRNVTITDHSVAFSGLTTINYNGGIQPGNNPATGVTGLQVTDGLGVNHVEVDSVPALTNVIVWGDTQDVLSGAAINMIVMHKTHT